MPPKVFFEEEATVSGDGDDECEDDAGSDVDSQGNICDVINDASESDASSEASSDDTEDGSSEGDESGDSGVAGDAAPYADGSSGDDERPDSGGAGGAAPDDAEDMPVPPSKRRRLVGKTSAAAAGAAFPGPPLCQGADAPCVFLDSLSRQCVSVQPCPSLAGNSCSIPAESLGPWPGLPDVAGGGFVSLVMLACDTLKAWRMIVRVCKQWQQGCTSCSDELLQGQLFVYALRVKRELFSECGDERKYRHMIQLGGMLLTRGVWKNVSREYPKSSHFDSSLRVRARVQTQRRALRFDDIFKFQFHATSTTSHTSGYYYAYDPSEQFAIMCHGSEKQGQGYGGDWFHLPMVDGNDRILKGPFSSNASDFNKKVSPPITLRLHEVYQDISVNMLYITEKYLEKLQKTKPEMWPAWAQDRKASFTQKVTCRSRNYQDCHRR